MKIPQPPGNRNTHNNSSSTCGRLNIRLADLSRLVCALPSIVLSPLTQLKQSRTMHQMTLTTGMFTKLSMSTKPIALPARKAEPSSEDERKIQDLRRALAKIKQQEADLTIQLAEVLLRVEEKKQPEEQSPKPIASAAVTNTERIHGFARGDRVCVLNRMNMPANWDTNARKWKEEKRATVTEILIKGPVIQIHIETDNNVKTWRADGEA
jgi:hypothetical protein